MSTTTEGSTITNENNKRPSSSIDNNNNQVENEQQQQPLKQQKTDITTSESSTTTNKQPKVQSIFKGKFKAWKKHSRLFATNEKVHGALIMCDQSRESFSVGEVLRIFNIYADKYFPKNAKPISSTSMTKTTTPSTESKKEDQDDDENEDEKLENNNNNNNSNEDSIMRDIKKRFELINAGCGGIFFVHFVQDIDPVAFIDCIFIDLIQRYKSSNKQTNSYLNSIDLEQLIQSLPPSTKTMLNECNQDIKITDKDLIIKFTSRIIPIISTTVASDATLYPMMKDMINSNLNNTNTKTFAIEYRSRNNTVVNKSEIITKIAEMVNPTIKVDLKNAETVILVEIIKSSVAATISTNFHKFSKYNIREFANYQQPPSSQKKEKKDKKDKKEKNQENENKTE
eukprot:gene7871-9688_t